MKAKGNKVGSESGHKKLNLKGAKKPSAGFRKGKKKISKPTSKHEHTVDEKITVRKENGKNYASNKGEKNANKSASIAFKKKFKQNKGKKNKSANLSSDLKRKSDDDSGQVRKKPRIKKEGDEQPRLDKKDLKVVRRKRKHNYELTVSLIKKYDGLRRYGIACSAQIGKLAIRAGEMKLWAQFCVSECGI